MATPLSAASNPLGIGARGLLKHQRYGFLAYVLAYPWEQTPQSGTTLPGPPLKSIIVAF